MSFWGKFIESISGIDNHTIAFKGVSRDASRYAFVDVEVGVQDKKIHDIGALRWDRSIFHSASKYNLLDFLKG